MALTVTLDDLAEALGVHIVTLAKTYRKIEGFPTAHIIKRCLRFSEAEAKAFVKANRKHIKTLMAEARAAYAAEESAISPFNALAVRFIRGEFASPEQRQAIALKRLVARQLKPKTHRISLVHDWMQDEGRWPQHKPQETA